MGEDVNCSVYCELTYPFVYPGHEFQNLSQGYRAVSQLKEAEPFDVFTAFVSSAIHATSWILVLLCTLYSFVSVLT